MTQKEATRLKKEIRAILDGIDRTQTDDEDTTGYWETSDGAKFGKRRLELIEGWINSMVELRMSPEEQSFAIAEACSRHYHRPTEEEKKTGSYYQYEPNYAGDLNLMHEAENHIMKRSGMRQRYVAELRSVCADIDVWHATSHQRAQAFLQAIGKWKYE